MQRFQIVILNEGFKCRRNKTCPKTHVYGYLKARVRFRSYTQPAIVMSSIPFGIIGAVLGHMIMGYNLSVMSLFGMVALAGVVVNDSLVLVDFANRERRRGLSNRAALVSAGIRRFRPILLTSLTTFGGLMPIIFETSRQARHLIPMALSLGFGVLFATFITLLLVPSLYLIVEDLHQWAGAKDTSEMVTYGGVNHENAAFVRQ